MKRLDVFNELVQHSFPESISLRKKTVLMLDLFWERLIYKTELQDYFQYEFYKLRSIERRQYMTFARLRYVMKQCNDVKKRKIFDDKVIFNRTFSAFFDRKWMDVTAASFSEFKEFIKENPIFFAKARSGMFGKNAGKYEINNIYNNDEEQLKLYKELKKNECIIEQLISQHPNLEMFNASSVNTLRIVTLLDTNKNPQIMSGVLRMGRNGKTADNFHHYGIAATIDVKTGIVISPGIDRDFKRYIIHPDSNVQIIGFQIPSWKKAINLVQEAAMVVPSVRYVGWDVAVDKNGDVQLIEGNYGADPDVTQMPIRKGIWPLFERELKNN